MPPRLFVSHASEDKERFAIEFATRLRSDVGIDAWFDRWEIRGGDSLVAKIFDEGLGQSDAVALVLSHASVLKPWVREELEVAVVRRIENDRQVRLIPITLDEDVATPTSVSHLLRYSVPDLGIEEVVRLVARDVYGDLERPELAPAPRYLAAGSGVVPDPIDDVVFGLILDAWRGTSPSTQLMSDSVQAQARELDVNDDAFAEAMSALRGQGLIKFNAMAGGRRWWLLPPPDRVWLDHEAACGVDLEDLRSRVLAAIVNDHLTTLDHRRFGCHYLTFNGIMGQLRREGLVDSVEMSTGGVMVQRVDPLARRALRNS